MSGRNARLRLESQLEFLNASMKVLIEKILRCKGPLTEDPYYGGKFLNQGSVSIHNNDFTNNNDNNNYNIKKYNNEENINNYCHIYYEHHNSDNYA
ncbi:hypothetical protein KIN20_002573 [Parelaphostrongylus tenuis]|uniref:Uncharacterized protein n=1 Tax=Parelaphostrongylus tenuis TaxID=148309 RepID=A0AAD5QD47_PARTN|nr:hypothetical protein KIN20_002573 [Parelaphostrongylus tenuis]